MLHCTVKLSAAYFHTNDVITVFIQVCGGAGYLKEFIEATIATHVSITFGNRSRMTGFTFLEVLRYTPARIIT